MSTNYCCDDFADFVDRFCGVCSGWDCPELILVSTQHGWGIPSGQSSYVTIHFCPWCGTDLEEQRQAT